MTGDTINCQRCLLDSEECRTRSLGQSLGLPQPCLEEPHWASMLVVPLVISADVLTVGILLMAIIHWLG